MRDMLGREDAVSVDEAKRLLSQHLTVKKIPSVKAPISEAYERVLAEDVFSPEGMPAFTRSTVDGFAVNAADTFGATEGMPSYLTVSQEVQMGREAAFSLERGAAAKIPTGGMLPSGADAVVMLEYVQSAAADFIEVLKPVAPGENVITAGEDVGEGELILRKGSVLRPQDIAAFAGVGITAVTVHEKPRVSIISTGDEIVPAGSSLMPGQVRDINSYTLAGLVLENGGIPLKKGIIPDVHERIRDTVLDALRDSDMVLISGGSSVGAKDMAAEIINGLGSPGVLFHGVALKPGKPTIGAVVDGVPVFGLPGHPAAVAVCFEIFVLPVLGMLRGERAKGYSPRRSVRARMGKNVASVAGREEHVRVVLEERAGELRAIPVLGKSGLIRTLVKADGRIVIPSNLRGIEEGEEVEVFLFG